MNTKVIVCEYEVNQLANETVIRGKRNFTQLINDAGRRKTMPLFFQKYTDTLYWSMFHLLKQTLSVFLEPILTFHVTNSSWFHLHQYKHHEHLWQFELCQCKRIPSKRIPSVLMAQNLGLKGVFVIESNLCVCYCFERCP